MHGSLEPEENVMKNISIRDIPNHDWIQNKDGFFAWEDNGIMDRVQDFIETLDWESTDNIVVEIAGTQVSGIDVGEVYNKKWQSPMGTRKYNKEAFIVLKNLSRDSFESSQPMDRPHEPHHSKTPDIVVNMDGGVGGSWEVKEEDDKS